MQFRLALIWKLAFEHLQILEFGVILWISNYVSFRKLAISYLS